jgi:hypothetical protein
MPEEEEAAVAEPALEREALPETCPLLERCTEGEGDFVAAGLLLLLLLKEVLPEALSLALPLGLTLLLPVHEALCRLDAEPVALGCAALEPEALLEASRLREARAEGLAEALTEPELLGQAEEERLAEALPLALPLALRLALPVPVLLCRPVAEGMALAEAVLEGKALPDCQLLELRGVWDPEEH